MLNEAENHFRDLIPLKIHYKKSNYNSLYPQHSVVIKLSVIFLSGFSLQVRTPESLTLQRTPRGFAAVSLLKRISPLLKKNSLKKKDYIYIYIFFCPRHMGVFSI